MRPVSLLLLLLLRLMVPLLLLTAVLAACSTGDGDEPSGATAALPAEAAAGLAVAESEGCVSCHGGNGRDAVGPTWDGLLGTDVHLTDGTVVVADRDYVRRAIVEPDAQVRDGFALQMPQNRLTPDEVDAVIAYIEHLAQPEEGSS